MAWAECAGWPVITCNGEHKSFQGNSIGAPVTTAISSQVSNLERYTWAQRLGHTFHPERGCMSTFIFYFPTDITVTSLPPLPWETVRRGTMFPTGEGGTNPKRVQSKGDRSNRQPKRTR